LLNVTLPFTPADPRSSPERPNRLTTRSPLEKPLTLTMRRRTMMIMRRRVVPRFPKSTRRNGRVFLNSG
jgi:hypothetical protein